MNNKKIINASGNKITFQIMIDRLNQYIRTHENCNIIVGCDSQKIKHKFCFATAIAAIDKGNGGIFFILKQYKTPHKKFKTIKSMIAWKVYQQANQVTKIIQFLENNQINLKDKITHHDLSYNGLSSEHIDGVSGWMKSMGYTPQFKPKAVVASGLANMFSKT